MESEKIEAIRARNEERKRHDAFDGEYFIEEATEDIDALLNALPRWVSVGEGLPGSGEYIVAWKFPSGKWCVSGGCWDGRDWESCHWLIRRVTHWMPLPEPPSEEGG